MILLSVSGTIKVILILLVVLFVLRMIQRSAAASARKPPSGTHWSAPDSRPKGDVRIEKAGDANGPRREAGPIEDADFEEVR